MTVYKCLHNQAPDYLSELYTPVAQVAERQHLRSASRRLLVVPRIQLDTYGRRALAVIGPTVWNALGNDLPDPDLSIAQYEAGGSLLTSKYINQINIQITQITTETKECVRLWELNRFFLIVA